MSEQVLPSSIPDFSLAEHGGGAFVLSSALRDAMLVIVFIRGHWCPYCRRYLSKLAMHYDRIQSAGGRVVVISPEPAATSRSLVRELKLPFGILGDTTGRIIDLFGVRNRFTSVRSLLPHAGVFVIDRDRRVRFASIDRNYKKRTTIRAILLALHAAASPADARLAHPLSLRYA